MLMNGLLLLPKDSVKPRQRTFVKTLIMLPCTPCYRINVGPNYLLFNFFLQF